MILPEVNLLVEHARHKLQVSGSGPEYAIRFPSLFSALHYALNLWKWRDKVPPGVVIRLEWSKFTYKLRG